MRADLPAFIETLRQNREARSESLYASDKVYALLDAYDAVREAADALASEEPVAVPAAKLLAIRDALAAGDVPEAYHVLYSIACPGFDSFTPWAGLEAATSPVVPVAAKAEAEGWRPPVNAHVADQAMWRLYAHAEAGKTMVEAMQATLEEFVDRKPWAVPTCEGEGT